MQVAQFGTRNHPQVLIEGPPQPVERLEGLGLPPVAIQRDHQLAPSPFTQRTTSHQTLQPGHDLVVTAKRQLRVEQILTCRFAQLLQSRRFRLGERAVSEFLQRCSAPQVQGLPQPSRRSGWVRVPAARGDQAFRQPRVDRLRRSPQAVPRWPGDDAQAWNPGHGPANVQHIVL